MDERTPKEWLQKINSERKNGNVCFMTFEGLASMPLENFVNQPAEGILYDLNRLPEVVASWIDGDKKWVNDYAVGDTIKYLKEQNDALQAKLEDVVEAIKRAECLLDSNFGFRSQEAIDAWNILRELIKNLEV